MKVRLTVILLSLLGLSACNKNVLVDSFHELPETGWKYSEVLIDSFKVNNPDNYHQLLANIRINGDYQYANIYLKINITSPDSSQKEEIVTLTLADKTGKWLGSGSGDVITYQEPILGKQKFTKGTYYVQLEQYMRLEMLPNVVSAGIKVEQLEETL